VNGAWLQVVVLQSPTPFEQPPGPSLHLPELVIAGILALFGIRSLARWLMTHFDARSLQDQLLFSLHTAARVGLWFAFAGFFFGLALVDEPRSFIRWYVFVPIGLAGVQLMTAVFGSRSPGNPSGMERTNQSPGPLEPEKHGETAEPGLPQPEAAEVESARLLENQARVELRAAGLTDQEIRRLADEYIALDRGEELDAFIAWAREQVHR
jgi:hypothetical protein